MKKFFSIALAVMMMFSWIPTSAIAEKDNSENDTLKASITFDNDLVDEVSQKELIANGDYGFVDGVLPDTKALHIEGGDDNYVGTEESLSFGEDNFTVSFWYKGDTADDQVILSNKDFSEDSDEGWAIYTDDNAINMNLGFPSSEEENVSFGRDTFEASEWRYVTFVVDRDNMLAKLHIDGYEMTSATLNKGDLDTSNPLNIGADGEGNAGENSFDIANLTICDEALSDDDVQANYKKYDMNNVDMKELNEEITEAEEVVENGPDDGFSDSDFNNLKEVLDTASSVASAQENKLYTQETINYYERELADAIFIYEKSNKDETPADLNFLVNSDTEITDDSDSFDRVEDIFRKSLDQFPQADVMYIPGDVTGGNNPEEYLYMNDLTDVYHKLEDEGLFDGIDFYLARGNHDMEGAEDLIPEGSAGPWNESKESYDNGFYNDAYRVDLNGFDLVVFDGNINNGNTAGKAKELLEEITNEPDYDPTKPIFVSSHFPVEDTVWGSDWSSPASNSVGEYIAENDLSQVVYIAGHSHYDPTDERSIYQGDATYLEAGSTAYSSYIDDGPYGGYIEGDYVEYNADPRISNFIEVYGTKMIIKYYNTNTDEYVGKSTVLNVGEGEDAYTYNNDDTKELIAPEFDESITIDSMDDDTINFTMKQAEDNVRVLEYNLQLINKITGEVEESFNSLSLPMDDPYEEYKEYEMTDLDPDIPYTLRVFANDSMYNRTSQDIDINVDSISVSSMKELVADYKEEEEFEDDSVAHKLDLHLTSVEHYEKMEAADKVVKHMKGFKLLLENQNKNELISDEAYDTLKKHADYVIQAWS